MTANDILTLIRAGYSRAEIDAMETPAPQDPEPAPAPQEPAPAPVPQEPAAPKTVPPVIPPLEPAAPPVAVPPDPVQAALSTMATQISNLTQAVQSQNLRAAQQPPVEDFDLDKALADLAGL